MKLELDIAWHLGPDRVKPAPILLFALLRGVEREGSLSAAAKQCKVSYRGAWNLVNEWADYLESPLMHSIRGQGATLSPLGVRLVSGFDYAKDQMRDLCLTTASHIQLELDRALEKPSSTSLSIQASHCLSHDLLRQLYYGQTGSRLDLKHSGSGRSLEHLQAGDCDVAGFHFADGEPGRALSERYLRVIDPTGIRLIQGLKRRQGLIVKSGNPLHLQDIGDLVKPDVRIVNRQLNSGTRLLLDQLLYDAGINPRTIAGYDNVEFTHSAVAALVAGDSADVAVGTEAAALKFGLGFIPLVNETYYYAIPVSKWDNCECQALLGLLAGPGWKQGISQLKGYDASEAGQVQEAEMVLKPDPVD